jgi:hypothetical protein
VQKYFAIFYFQQVCYKRSICKLRVLLLFVPLIFKLTDYSSGTLNKKARTTFLNTQILNKGQNLCIRVKGIIPLQAIGGYPPTLLANNGFTPCEIALSKCFATILSVKYLNLISRNLYKFHSATFTFAVVRYK